MRAKTSAASQDDRYGLSEIAGKSAKEILGVLFARRSKMVSWFEICSEESGFREIMDHSQMGKDFWLYAFAKQVDSSALRQEQKTQLLQVLLDTFGIKNEMTAERHYREMTAQASYKRYLEKCFGISLDDSAAFWRLLGAMSGNDGERLPMTEGFVSEYVKFMMQMEIYLELMFRKGGFGGHMKNYVTQFVTYLADHAEKTDDLSDAERLINPVISSGTHEEGA